MRCSQCVCVSLLACLCRAQRAWRRCVPGHVSWSGMQPGPCNMTRRQPVSGSWTRLSPVRPVLSAMRSADPMTACILFWAKSAACNHPWTMAHGSWTSNMEGKQARGETFHSRHAQNRVCRFGLLLHQLAVSSFHLAPLNEPDGPPFSPFSEEGPKERVSGVIEADDDGGPHTFTAARPRCPSGYRPSIQIPKSRVGTCATHPRERLLQTPHSKGEATSDRFDQGGMP